jgi:hypothetical protein
MRYRFAVSAALLLLLASLMPTAALAHERRAVGKYTFVVGFNDEPAVQGQPNGAQITVTVPSEDNRPVEGLADTLKANVAFGGGQAKDFKLRSVFGKPGQYVADFVPTRAGSYIFTFTGSIEGTPINERFESGPGRFDDVDAVDTLQFPDVIPLSNDVARSARSAEDRAASAEAEAAGARSVAMAGVGLGVLGIVLGAIAVAMMVSMRRSAAVPGRARGSERS